MNKLQEHLRSWLTDPQARDQFVLYRADDVVIFWNKKTEPPEEVHKRIVGISQIFIIFT